MSTQKRGNLHRFLYLCFKGWGCDLNQKKVTNKYEPLIWNLTQPPWKNLHEKSNIGRRCLKRNPKTVERVQNVDIFQNILQDRQLTPLKLECVNIVEMRNMWDIHIKWHIIVWQPLISRIILWLFITKFN